MRRASRLVACLYLLSSAAIPVPSIPIPSPVAATATSTSTEHHAAALIEWLEQEPGGFFHPSLEMRRSDPSSASSPFGMFATAFIPADALLLRIPHSLILNSTEADPALTPLVCGTVRNLAHHLRLAHQSHYAPYVTYLLDTQPPGQLPSAWSKAGQSLLLRFLGDDGNAAFPPEYPVDWITDDWHEQCDGSADPLDEYAALLVVQRAWDDLLIPVYDMMSHRNGWRMNTRSSPVHEDGAVTVSARRDIHPGEEMYTTYNLCEDCGARYHSYGTPEILRDYGFVEQFPQSWILHDVDVAFRIDEVLVDVDDDDDDDHDDDHHDKDNTKKTKVKVTEWIQNKRPKDEESLDALRDLLDQVLERKELLLDETTRDASIPDHEWDTIVVYANALQVALQTALESARIEDLECIQDGTCHVTTLQRYANLDDRELSVWTDVDDDWPTCNDEIEMGKYDDGTYELLEDFKSPYQHLSFMMQPGINETCFDLDGTIQICDSYRPHYHEWQVHQAARYLNSMKRVLWVGGGDSMLLHEFLKYPDLELAVGLELDQRVVRGAFKHFGTQPHFDRTEAVEWWFGDATKSLMMLPKDYFGSFDMVVVDLSETVMSLTVTDKLDVIEALTLLLKPDGVFIKNEFYFGQFKAMFPHSVQMHWYDNPVICSQAIAIGSYSINFMKKVQKDFGVEGLLIEPLDETEDPYQFYHDYARNYTSREICDVLLEKEDQKGGADGHGHGHGPVQTSSPGILFVVEAEDVSLDLSDVTLLEHTLTTALAKEGLTTLVSSSSRSAGSTGTTTTTTTTTASGSIITIMLDQGYVVARCMPEQNYCGLDIHFWTSLDSHSSTKDALVAAIGGHASSTSSYRIIAGGIFGYDSWQEDEKNRGPQYEDICHQRTQAREAEKDATPSVTETTFGAVDQSTIDSMLEESLFLIPREGEEEEEKKVMMLIGNDGMIGSSAAVANINGVTVDTLYCPSMVDFNEFENSALEKATTCERHLTNSLSELALTNGKFHAILIDSNADKLTSSILLKIFTARRKTFAKRILQDNALVVSPMLDESEKWRRNLVQLFKVDVFKFDPTWYVEIGVSDSHGSMKVLVANESDPHFVQRLNQAVAAHEKKSGLLIEVEVVDGGKFTYQDDPFEPTKSFLPSDYDQSAPLKQWKSQVPLGHQIIFQMEYTDSKTSLSPEIVKKNLKNAISKTDIAGLELNDDDGDDDEEVIHEYLNVGHGCVLMTTWSGGSVVVLWDGRKHIDVNFFTYVEDVKVANAFEANFRGTLKYLKTMLRDEQPRGVGRVVSYFSDLSGDADPHWA